MGKSLGNVINIRDALKEYPSEALRFYLLQNHYRSSLPWSSTALNEALTMLARLYEAKEAALAMGGQEPAAQVAQSLGEDAQTVLRLGGPSLTACTLPSMRTLIQPRCCRPPLSWHVPTASLPTKARKRGGPIVAKALAGFEVLADAIGLLGSEPASFQAEVKLKRLAAMGLKENDIEAHGFTENCTCRQRLGGLGSHPRRACRARHFGHGYSGRNGVARSALRTEMQRYQGATSSKR